MFVIDVNCKASEQIRAYCKEPNHLEITCCLRQFGLKMTNWRNQLKHHLQHHASIDRKSCRTETTFSRMFFLINMNLGLKVLIDSLVAITAI